jgi:hypothetical protein
MYTKEIKTSLELPNLKKITNFRRDDKTIFEFRKANLSSKPIEEFI